MPSVCDTLDSIPTLQDETKQNKKPKTRYTDILELVRSARWVSLDLTVSVGQHSLLETLGENRFPCLLHPPWAALSVL